MKLRHLILSLCIFLPWLAQAQADSCKNHFSVGLVFSARGEYRGGGLPKPQTPDAVIEDRSHFLWARTRLVLGYERSWLETRAVIQNSAVWGMKGNMALNLYEGWVKAKAPFGLFGQVGRIALSYDDERIIGPNDFAMTAKSHDVLRLGYEGHGHRFHVILAYNQDADNPETGTFYSQGPYPYKTMHVGWYHYDVPVFPLGVSLLFMNTGLQAGSANQNPHIVYQQLVGGYLAFKPKYFGLEGSFYYQFGNFGQAGEDGSIPVRAWMASVKAVGKPFPFLHAELGYDYLSGDDYVSVPLPGALGVPQHKVLKGFTPIYGSTFKFYGMMDYFYESAYIQGFTPGLQNAFVGVHARPVKPLSLSLTYHYLAVATQLKDLSRTLGHSLELESCYQFTKDIAFSAGFTFMAGTETMERLKQSTGSKYVTWGWFSLKVSPTIFSWKW